MNLVDLLKQVLDIKGVASSAVVSSEGFIVEGVSHDDADLGFVGGLIASSLASGRVLAGLLGDGEITQSMIEYERGPVLLMPVRSAGADGADGGANGGADDGADDEGGHVLVVVLESTATLGRVRFQLRKLLPEIARAVAA